MTVKCYLKQWKLRQILLFIKEYNVSIQDIIHHPSNNYPDSFSIRMLGPDKFHLSSVKNLDVHLSVSLEY